MYDPLSAGTHTIDVDGLIQRYHVYGRGPVCVAHPGGPGMLWDYLRMPTLERHMKLIYIEPLGTGDSDRLKSHPDGYTRALYGEAVDRLLDHLGQPKVILLGHAYGALVAQRYAVAHRDRLAGVVLYESVPATGFEHGSDVVQRLEEFAQQNAQNPELPFIRELLESVPDLTDDNMLTAALRLLLPAYLADYWARAPEYAKLRAEIKANYISGLDAQGAPDVVDDRALLPDIAVPTLVFSGRYDVLCGTRWAREVHELVPGSRLHVLENSGHMGHLEEPEAFTNEMLKFVADIGWAR